MWSIVWPCSKVASNIICILASIYCNPISCHCNLSGLCGIFFLLELHLFGWFLLLLQQPCSVACNPTFHLSVLSVSRSVLVWSFLKRTYKTTVSTEHTVICMLIIGIKSYRIQMHCVTMLFSTFNRKYLLFSLYVSPSFRDFTLLFSNYLLFLTVCTLFLFLLWHLSTSSCIVYLFRYFSQSGPGFLSIASLRCIGQAL